MNDSSLYFVIQEINKRHYSTYSLFFIYRGSQKVTFRMLLKPKNPNQNWVLRGQFSHVLGSAWSCLVLVRNDQKIISRHRLVLLRGVPGTGDRAFAPWLQKHSESHFFGTPCIQICICAYSTLIYMQQQLQIQTATHMNTVAAAAVQTQVSSNLACCVFCVSNIERFDF